MTLHADAACAPGRTGDGNKVEADHVCERLGIRKVLYPVHSARPRLGELGKQMRHQLLQQFSHVGLADAGTPR